MSVELHIPAHEVANGDLLWRAVVVTDVEETGNDAVLILAEGADRSKAEIALPSSAMVTVLRQSGGFSTRGGVVTRKGHYDRYIAED